MSNLNQHQSLTNFTKKSTKMIVSRVGPDGNVIEEVFDDVSETKRKSTLDMTSGIEAVVIREEEIRQPKLSTTSIKEIQVEKLSDDAFKEDEGNENMETISDDEEILLENLRELQESTNSKITN